MASSRLSLFCDRALEAGWLIGVMITPVFFNVYSSRVFEPDKLTTLRALAVVMAVLWITRFVDERTRGEEPLRFSMQTPMVLPALVTMAAYLISTLVSVVPFTSLVGSYQRLQGTYSLFGYLVIFLAVITSLRTRLQLSRLITVLILSSLPVALYGIIQHNGLDPLPWAGDVTRRVASNMGNAIFVAAYLIMIVPLTAARIIQGFGDILGREEARISDVLRTSGYIFVLAVQLLTIWYSQSRGPWLGIVASAFLFPYLALIVLQRQALGEREAFSSGGLDVIRGVGFGLGSLALAGLLAGFAVWALGGRLGLYVGLVLGLLGFGGLWLHFVAERKGWRWLWIGWGSVGLTLSLALVAVNVPGVLQTQVRQIQPLRRLTTITELQAGTGKVRALIWQGTVDLISVHEPLSFPGGGRDRLNPIRPLVGYGPESMYVVYNSFYPPELGHYEARTASPDRAHNEVLDALVITGVLGLAAYLFTFGSFFGWGFHWLGLLASRRQLFAYLGLQGLFIGLFFLIGWQLEGAYLFAVAIPLGILVGMMAYLTLQGFRGLFVARAAAVSVSEVKSTPVHPHTLLLMGLIAGVMAHFVEMNFGIAIAATRTVFWTFAGLLVALGGLWVSGHSDFLEMISEDDVPEATQRSDGAKTRRRRRRHYSRSNRGTLFAPWTASVVALALTATFLLGTLAFNFINNPDRLSRAGQIFVRSLTMRYFPEPARAYGALMIFVFTWALFGIIGLCEFDREGLFDRRRSTRWPMAIAIYAGVSFLGVLFFGSLIAGHQAALIRIPVTSLEQIVQIADRLSGLLARYYGLVFVLLGLMGWVLLQEGRQTKDSGSLLAYGVLVVLLLASIPIIRGGSYNLVRADIIFKQGSVFANSHAANEKQVGIQHFELAIDYAPHEDYYYLFLGKTYLELAQSEALAGGDRTPLFLRTEEILTHARELNPLNTDHSANLARFYKSWAARISMDLQADGVDPLELDRLVEQRQTLLARALGNYETALMLSPNNPILWNELAQLYAADIGDEQKFEETIAQSLAVDDAFEQTWMLIGDLSAAQGDIDRAIDAYQRSLEISNNCTVRRVVGTLLAQASRWEETISFLESSIELCGDSRELWELHRIRAIALTNQGETAAALRAAQMAWELAPVDQRSAIQELIEQLAGEPVSPVELP